MRGEMIERPNQRDEKMLQRSYEEYERVVASVSCPCVLEDVGLGGAGCDPCKTFDTSLPTGYPCGNFLNTSS